MKNLLLAWIVVLPWCVQAQSEIGLPLATHYDMKMKETLSTWRISEQPNGSLYLAAELLLAQYDGVKFTTMAKCQAACLAVDADGKTQSVPAWEPKDENDIKMRDYAIKLMNLRKEIEAEMEPHIK